MDYVDIIEDMCVHLNHLISLSLSKHHVRDDPLSLQARDSALTQAKAILTDFLNGLPKNPNVQALIDLQAELTTLMGDVNIYADEIPMEMIFQVNRLVSEALANHCKTENMELLIQLNKEISAALIDRGQMVRREKLQSIMAILSKKIKDSVDKTETTRALFRFNDVLLDTLAENCPEKKHELLLKLNILLGAYMVSGHKDKGTEWLVKLNYYAAIIMVKNFTDPTQLYLMNQFLASAIRKTLPVDAIFKDLTQLNFFLSGIILSSEVPHKLSQMIEWKLIFSDVMQEALEGNCPRYMDEQGTTVFKQVTFAEIACLKAQLAQALEERDFFMGELKKSNPSYATSRLNTTVQRDIVEGPKPAEKIAGKGGAGSSKASAEEERNAVAVVDEECRKTGLQNEKKFQAGCVKPANLNEVTHLRLILSENGEVEQVDEEVPRNQERVAARRSRSSSSEKAGTSAKGTEIVEKKKADEPGQQKHLNVENPAGTQMQVKKTAEEAGKAGEEKREAPKEEKKVKIIRYTYALPPGAKKDFKKPDPRPKEPEKEK